MDLDNIARLGRQIRKGDCSSTQLVEAALSRIAAEQVRLGAFATVMNDRALADAAKADAELRAGFDRGPLHGIPVAVKDLFWTKDAPMAAGTKVLADWVAPEDAAVVTRLRRAGAIIVGKTQMTEGATVAHHPEVQTPVNPWSAGHCAGFSSSGSGVAVAAGLCAAAIGSDTGGSIRIPSSMNGITGLKPSRGRVSRHGSLALVERLDTFGPMACSAADCAAVLTAIAGPDAADPTTWPHAAPNYLAMIDDGAGAPIIGYDRDWLEEICDGEVLAVLDAAAAVLADLGAQIVPIKLPRPDLSHLMALVSASFAHVHRETYPARAEAYGPNARQLLEHGRSLSGADLVAAMDGNDRLVGRIDASFTLVDMVLAPVFTFVTPEVGALEAGTAGSSGTFTMPVNAAGNPSLALPGGFDRRGLPVGFQIVGRRFEEAALLRLGHAFQRVTEWHLRRPPAG